MRVSVGIHVHAEPARLSATLRALSAPSTNQVDVIVLPDGPDPETRRALASLSVPQCGTDEPLGPPACLNRLAVRSDGDVVVLLESGAIAAPGALDRLVEILRADSRNGIVGPSTNEAWNEQRVMPGGSATPSAIARAGKWLAGRHGSETRSLAPLHSLSDFCFAVRREVIVAIGGADEGYALGPCWEMEYTARAVRAGFRVLWACGAYVYRAPFTPRRRIEEERRFDASKRRYQDSLCGLRLLGKRPDYEPHCRGEACEHFAPAHLIQLRRPLPAPSECPLITPAPHQPEPVVPDRPVPSPPTAPLVSCVMPTRDRAEFALQAIRLFQAQDYEPRELIIVDDGDDSLEELLPDDARIRYVRCRRGESIGTKRNLACARANGDFLVQWDDDDWYAPNRLSVQLGPLIRREADITGLRSTVFFELESWRFWAVSGALHRRLFREDVHGGTLAFTRKVWTHLAQYPPASLAEDAAFLVRARARGARLVQLDGQHLFLYLRHGRNAWRFRCGEFLDPAAWRIVAEPLLPSADRVFYAARSAHAPPPPNDPLVSCIMPTANRRRWVPAAIDYFQRQDYPNRELIVLDDGEDRVVDVIPPDSRIRYVALERRLVLGEKRNRACELARGEIIAHWDDDDWQASNRLRYQVDALEAGGGELCGANKTLYFAPDTGGAWLYCYPEQMRGWVAGSSLCYRRSLWHENRFAPVGVGEDTRFVWDPRVGKPQVLADHRFYAALIHPGNSSRKVTQGSFWQARPIDEVRSLLGQDWARYEP